MQIALRITPRADAGRAGNIPASVVKALELKEGNCVEIIIEGEELLSIRRSAKTRELLERVRKLRGKLPEGFRFKRQKANER